MPSRFGIDQVFDLAEAIHELTTDMATLARVPEVLVQSLNLGSLVFALVDIRTPNPPVILALKVYGTPILCSEMTADVQVRQEILTLCQPNVPSTSTLQDHLVPPVPESLARCVNGLKCPLGHASFCGQCRQAVLIRHVDADHRLILMINHHPQETAIPLDTLEALQLVLEHLVKSLHILVSCQHYPPCLGDPFTTLTNQEWIVLCAQNSDASEKQLADSLGISPHTLHSHIKSIYHKLDVRGRLPLIHKFRRALQDYRLRSLCTQH